MPGADYCRIPLHAADGAVRAHALVDASDADLADYRWSLLSVGYASRCVRADGAQRSLLLHRQILGLTHGDGLQSDHINGDRLDNRRANLRVVTHAQNAQNVPPRGGKSKYRGVAWNAGKWRATVIIGGNRHDLGRFTDEHEAGAAARAFRAKHMPYVNEERAA